MLSDILLSILLDSKLVSNLESKQLLNKMAYYFQVVNTKFYAWFPWWISKSNYWRKNI